MCSDIANTTKHVEITRGEPRSVVGRVQPDIEIGHIQIEIGEDKAPVSVTHTPKLLLPDGTSVNPAPTTPSSSHPWRGCLPDTVGDRIMSYVSVRPGHCITHAMRRDRSCRRSRLSSGFGVGAAPAWPSGSDGFVAPRVSGLDQC
jgi:hypothetical protein